MSDAVTAKVREIERTLPPGVKLDIVRDAGTALCPAPEATPPGVRSIADKIVRTLAPLEGQLSPRAGSARGPHEKPMGPIRFDMACN